MRRVRTSLIVAVAIAVPVVMFTVGGSIAAARSVAGTKPATGTITCTAFTGTVSFNPPLVPGTATSKTDTETASGSTLGSCVTSPSGGPTSATSVSEKATKLKGNACSTLASTSHTGASFTIDWPGVKASKVKFSGASQTSDGYSLSNGKVSGSYKTTSGSANIVIDPSSIAAITSCVEGEGGSISSITISGGSMTL